MAKTSKKTISAAKADDSAAGFRKKPLRESFRTRRSDSVGAKTIPSGRMLFRQSFSLLWKNKKTLAKILGIYLLLYIMFVRGFSGSLDVRGLKSDLSSQGLNRLDTGLGIFSVLVGQTSSAPTEVASIYQTMLLIIGSLVFIWTIRRLHANETVSVKDAYYKGVAPLVPFLLVLLVIGLQLLPLSIGAFVYGLLQSFGYLTTLASQTPALIIIGLLALLSVYLAVSSLIALYIVTLPDVEPMQALRAAKKLTARRRSLIMRRLVFLLVAITVIYIAVLLPLILIVPVVSEYVLLVLLPISFVLAHTYLYHLYRSML